MLTSGLVNLRLNVEVLKFLETVRKKSFEYSLKFYNNNKQLFDKNRKQISFNVDDMVYVENENKAR